MLLGSRAVLLNTFKRGIIESPDLYLYYYNNNKVREKI